MMKSIKLTAEEQLIKEAKKEAIEQDVDLSEKWREFLREWLPEERLERVEKEVEKA